MLRSSESPTPLPDLDRQVFDLIVPADHYLRQVAAHIDFERFRPRLAEPYSAGLGRPAIDPVRMLKILFLRFHYQLSDRQVMERAKTDMAFRWFLDLPLRTAVPNHTEGTYFRQRLGAERFVQIFQELLGQAREAGLVKDRLRLKDATHLFAAVADVQPLALAAQVRERLLRAAAPFFPDWVQAQRAALETLRQTTAEFADDERLAARLEHLRTLVAHLRERTAAWPPAEPHEGPRRRLQRAVAVAAKLVTDQSDPQAQDRLASASDPDARVGKHGGYFVGYLLDLSLDADSELITGVNVLPGNGAEAADALTLIRQEEAAQGNDVAGLSLDGAGYNGPVLRALTDPRGLNLDVTVPPPTPAARTTFGPERFSLQVLDAQHGEVTCPHGQTTRQRSRTRQGTGYRYQFKARQCAACPLREQCQENPASRRGRVVIKNDYEAEYAQVAAKAKTPEYQEVRRTHPKIERKLNEVVRHHQGRRACYRGLAKVLTQGVLTALVVNVKRMVKLLRQRAEAGAAARTVRAELGAT
ncbi:MAG: IS1182 family transposase [Streptosporangiaceae bacterium]|nr:IS1182 family transposase [Streptosporangiaceae bacterium]